MALGTVHYYANLREGLKPYFKLHHTGKRRPCSTHERGFPGRPGKEQFPQAQ